MLHPSAAWKIDHEFLCWLKEYNTPLAELLLEYRANASKTAPSNHLIAIAEASSLFLMQYLDLKHSWFAEDSVEQIWAAKTKYIQKYLSHLPFTTEGFSYTNIQPYFTETYALPLTELNLAIVINQAIEALGINKLPQQIQNFCLAVLHKLPGTEIYQHWQLFTLPLPLDYTKLVDRNDIKLQPRRGFEFNGDNTNLSYAQSHANYCIYCHNRGKDTCRTGMYSADEIKQNPLGNKLAGCPLDQQISEMNLLKAQGNNLAAIIMLMRDNPLAVLTGHRICNDCSKACIFQKQEPVDIPYIESQIVNSLLSIDYGFEIYYLLTQWQPLNFSAPVPSAASGRKVLVVGTGPAGITLSYYMLRAGHQVIAIDGMRISPLSKELVTTPVENFFALTTNCDQAAFGGVAAYGITSRWDKRLLLAARLILERSQDFSLFSGVRFGSNITEEQAWKMGFDYIGLALGAGTQQLLQIPGNLAPGVKMAADFLMTLHLAKPYNPHSLASLPLKLPVVVIGGGLTAIDAATEAAAYYPELVLNFSKKVTEIGGTVWLNTLPPKEHELAQLWLNHAHLYKSELQAATAKGREADFSTITRTLGGVKLIYHRELDQAASYRLNHQEIQESLKQGIEIIDNMSAQEIITNHHGEVEAIRIKELDGTEAIIKAASVLVAIGTKISNATYKASKISVVGDADPSYYGSVVKAIASSKATSPTIDDYLRSITPASNLNPTQFKHLCANAFVAKVIAIRRISSTKISIEIEAQLAAKNYHKGMYYKLENLLPLKEKYYLEPLALTPINVTGSVLTFEVNIIGASTMMVAYLQPGQEVSLMGPLGKAMPPEEEVKLVNAPMQCMMQGICAHCLQRKINPITGQYSYFYSCSEQWIKEDELDSQFLRNRAEANSLLELLNFKCLKVQQF